MKKLIIGATLLALAVTVAGCAKTSRAAKQPGNKEKPAATRTTEHGATRPVEHKTMKPVVPAMGTQHKTTPEAKPPEAAKPDAEAPATSEAPKENK